MRRKIKKLGLATIGLGVTVKEKIKRTGRKLTRKGDKEASKLMDMSGSKLEKNMKRGIHFAGKEALVISKKSLEMLEKELKKLERETRRKVAKKKTSRKKVAKKKSKKKVAKKKTATKKVLKKRTKKKKTTKQRKTSRRK